MQCDIAVDASLNANEIRAVTADRLPPRETPAIPELMAPGRPNKTGVTKSGFFNQRAEARIIRQDLVQTANWTAGARTQGEKTTGLVKDAAHAKEAPQCADALVRKGKRRINGWRRQNSEDE